MANNLPKLVEIPESGQVGMISRPLIQRQSFEEIAPNAEVSTYFIGSIQLQ